MEAIVVLLVSWLAVSLLLGIVVGKALRRVDHQEPTLTTADLPAAFRVDPAPRRRVPSVARTSEPAQPDRVGPGAVVPDGLTAARPAAEPREPGAGQRRDLAAELLHRS